MSSPSLIDTAEFAHRHFHHLINHPPDALLFPFLHGIEGSNHAQNNFFVSPYPPHQPPLPPNYTGLLWVVAEDDLDRDLKHSLYAERSSEEEEELMDDDDEEDEIDDPHTPGMDVDTVHVVGEVHMHPVAHRSPVDYAQVKDVGKPLQTADRRASHPSSDSQMSTDTRPSSPLPTAPATPPKHQLQYPPLLTSSFRPSDIIQQSQTGEWEFIPLAVPEGISLRNFGIQVPIYATVSDIVVYSPKGPSSAAWELARRLQSAILKKRQERLQKYANCSGTLDDQPWMNYRVLILDANERKMRQDLPHLMVSMLSADAAHTLWQNGETGNEMRTTHSHGSIDVPNTINFARREKDEMRELTRASEIISLSPPGVIVDNPNTDPRVGQVYLGHIEDVPLVPDLSITPLPIMTLPPEHPDSPFNPSQTNPSRFDICIECHELAPFPTVSQLKVAEDHLASLERKWMEYCSETGLPTDTPRPPPHANAVLHIPFPSSPASTAGTMALLIPLLRFFEKWVRPVTPSVASGTGEGHTPNGSTASRRWSTVSGLFPSLAATPPRTPSSPFRARSQTAPSPSPAQTPPHTRPLKVLLYSADGYTESSVPALCLLMVIRGLKLPEAYLELQVEKHRSFFVYTGDLSLLKRVESRIIKQPEARDEGGGTNIIKTPVAPYQEPPYVQGRPMGRPSAKSVSFPQAPGFVPVLPASSPATSSMRPPESPPSHPRRPRANTSPWLPSFRDHTSWFNDARFDGSFPSRVLPFLYLGNLNHASNVYMLHALGITHVVSVGECALVPPPQLHGDSYGQSDEHHSRSHAQLIQGKEGSLWIEEREGRIKVLDIKGVCDDGIDTLEPQLAPICDWIDKAREEGGKVLVHCRVGVSRSATVTIAYVMKYLKVPLADAYLIVRSRRLSVLIQPNMRLLYNLLGWEITLAKERAGGDPHRLKNELSGALAWPYLAKEVHALNEKYLH